MAGTPLTLPVGPVAVRLWLDDALAAQVPDAWRRAAASERAARVELRLVRTVEPTDPKSAHVFRGEAMSGGGCRLRRIRIDERAHHLCGESLADPDALSRAIRFASQPLLLSEGWLLVHASSVVLDGEAHLFTAPSRTGKSTLARALAGAGAELLGDEVALVGPEGVAVHPGQLPHGRLGRVVPLGTIHLLGRGGPSTEPVTKAAAAAELLCQAMVYEDSREAIDRTVALVWALVERARIVRTCVPLGPAALAHFGLGRA